MAGVADGAPSRVKQPKRREITLIRFRRKDIENLAFKLASPAKQSQTYLGDGVSGRRGSPRKKRPTPPATASGGGLNHPQQPTRTGIPTRSGTGGAAAD